MNSPLVQYTCLSPNHSGPRTHKIDTITIHCMAGNLSVEGCGALFASPSYQASSNYGVGSDGRIALYVAEGNRSWCSSSPANDQRAVTIEVANCGGGPSWPVSGKAYAALLDLCTDICNRNGKTKLLWFGNKAKTLSYTPKSGEMLLTVHRWFANKACPGEWLYSRQGEIAEEVTRRLGGVPAGFQPVVGGMVSIVKGALYGGLTSARGKPVPDYIIGRSYPVLRLATHCGEPEALLGGINSWVGVKFLK